MKNNNIIGIDPRNQIPENIEKLTTEVCELMELIEKQENLIKVIKDDLEKRKNELAEMLDTAGYAVGSSINLKNGKILKIEHFFNASIPSASKIEDTKDEFERQILIDRKERAINWLESNKLDGIIKPSFEISLDKGDEEKAKKIKDFLYKLETPYIFEQTVHFQTLKSTLKNSISNGIIPPFDIFSIVDGVSVKITDQKNKHKQTQNK